MMTPPRRHRRSPWLSRWQPLLAAGLASALVSCAASDTPDPLPPPEAPAITDTAQQEQELLTWTLGAKYDATQANIDFRVFSSRATRIEVWIYKTALGAQEVLKYVMVKDTATNIWSKSVSVATLKNATNNITGAVYYGYRAWGPNWPYDAAWTKANNTVGFISDVDAQGNRFNPNKLLWDPYALELSHDPVNATLANQDATVFASGPSYRYLDSGARAPKGIVLPPDSTATGTKPTRAFKDDVVYEVHLRGLTKQDTGSGLDANCLGTYKTAGQKAASLAALGVTAVEFLPLHETDNDNNDYAPTTTAGDNYWGYMNLSYFAPDRRYACDKSAGGPTREFKAMVKAFHDAGIKVLVDVVYNHTGEGGAWISGNSSTYNVMTYRGLDNPTYYSLTADKQFNWDNTGVGGNFNTFNPTAQNVILHSLSYWKDTLGVDGFRFDLASVLGNTVEHGGFNYDRDNAGTALNKIVTLLDPRPDAGGAGTDFIAEPWAIGGNSYQVGNFPAKWKEWNGIFRDTFRKDQNQMGGENVTPGQLATRFTGSSDLYGDDGRKPFHSVNFMVAHDGMTLKDLYSCNNKDNNQSWPYGPSDGGEDSNHSWDQGGNATLQRQAARNGMAFMMMSAGVPMLTGGDEFLRSQRCNNNVYNLDSNQNWLNYSWSTEQSNFRAFTRNLIAFRKAHPALRPANFYSASDTNGNVMEQHRWFKPDGTVPNAAYFDDAGNHALAYRIDATEFSGESVGAIYVAYNGWSGSVNFTLPWPGTGRQWYRVTDTCSWSESLGANQVVLNPGTTDQVGGENAIYGVCGRGVLVLVAK
ncbi:isoamylase [Corallococcus sp. bb12-1]|uniref:isoamylase n=1 Tax=Corallococcus sp. bb12-1 TaxID=2996784 RepID=UPI002270D5DD|nr:isoamylase [Corallococcus sp. bb12-1]MCY1040060.1 isoamylase [Corallococcus sp. bb12-1]